LLFGKRQTGMSLVSQTSAAEAPITFKTHFHRPMEGPRAGHFARPDDTDIGRLFQPHDRLLVEALLHSCLKLLREPAGGGGKADKPFKAFVFIYRRIFSSPSPRLGRRSFSAVTESRFAHLSH